MVRTIRLLQEKGARPRWAPSGHQLLFDRKNADGFNDLYLLDVESNSLRTLTDGKPGIGQRHNGNGVFHPSGAFIVFQSEEGNHMRMRAKWQGDPGLGLFSNLYATTPKGDRFWKLTNQAIKRNIFDKKTPALGIVNPLFSRDGKILVWTERYAKGSKGDWGKWRLMAADWITIDGSPTIQKPRILFTPRKGNYVTAIGWLDRNKLLGAGNLDGQHEFGMDLYEIDLRNRRSANLLPSHSTWEEGAAVSPDGRKIVYMSNQASNYALDFSRSDWHRQPRERDYWVLNRVNGANQRLTYFNDPSAPEYLGGRSITAALRISPDGRRIAGTLGVDRSKTAEADVQLKIVLIELVKPL